MRAFYGNPAAALLIIVTILVSGTIQFLRLPISLYPMTSKPLLDIRIPSETMNAREFQERFGEEVENALLAVTKVERVEGDYRNRNSRFRVEFGWGVDPEVAKTTALAALDSIKAQFPKQWGPIQAWNQNGNNGRVIVFLKSSKYSAAELEIALETTVIPKLERVNGIESAWVWRQHEQHVLITARPTDLVRFDLDYSSLRAKLQVHEFDITLGTLDLKVGGQFQVEAKLKQRDLDNLRDLVVSFRGGRAIKLSDVATVELVPVEVTEIGRINGERNVAVGGNPKPDANLRSFSDEFIKTLQEQVRAIDPDMHIDILLNPSTFINEAVENVLVSVLIGMITATMIVFLFMSSLRQTLVISIAIPLSLIAGFIVMRFLNIGINLISLGAMALAVGMVVDGAIVVLENIVRHFEIAKPRSRIDRMRVLVMAVEEVKWPIISSLLTTIIVFAPLPFTSPIASAILGDLATVMVCVLSVSIAVTLLIIPTLVIAFGIGPLSNKPKMSSLYWISAAFLKLFEWLQRQYLVVLDQLFTRSVMRWGLSLCVAALAAVGIYLLAAQVEREVIGQPDSDKLFLWISFKEDQEIEVSDVIASEYERSMREKFGEYLAFTFTSVENDGAWILGNLKQKSDVKMLKKKFEDHFKDSPEASVYVGVWQPTSLRIPNPPIVEARVVGSDIDQRLEKVDNIMTGLNKNEDLGQKDVRPQTSQSDFLMMEMNTSRLTRLRMSDDLAMRDFSERAVFDLINGYLVDTRVGEMDLGPETVAIDLRMPRELLKRPDDIEKQLIRIGEQIHPISSLVDISHSRDAARYFTENGNPINRIQVWAKESFSGDKLALRETVKKAILSAKEIDPADIFFEDTDKEVDENINSLVGALVIALVLITILITIQFGNLMQTLVIMLAIPLGFIGVAFSLWVFKCPLSINSMLGLILLCGTAVNNSILFVDFYVRSRLDSDDVGECLRKTAEIRFRPILITTLTTILGMMPIAVGWGSGGEILQPLGVAVCGGLGLSTLLTLLVVPLALMGWENWRVARP